MSLKQCIMAAKVRERFLGEEFWRRKIVSLSRDREKFLETKEKERASEERRLLRERAQRIRSELGIQFYLNKRKRLNMESMYPKPIVYLSDEYDVEVRFSEEDV